MLNKIDFSEINLSHAHSLFVNGILAYKLKKEKNIDYIVAVRSTDVNVFFKYKINLRGIGIEILRKAKKIIFISPSYKRKVFENYIPIIYKEELISKTEVIPNGIEKFWLKNLNSSKKKSNREINLIFVGNFKKRKNIPLCIKATQKLNEKGYNAKIVIVGRGKLESKIKRIESKKSFVKVVNWIDSKEALMDLYRKSDIFITPSHTETFGLVYIEALSQGLPIIYSRGEGIDGFFKSGEVGYPVEVDVNDIVEKIELINDNYDYYSDIKCKIGNRFDWEKIAGKYSLIYGKLFESRGNK